MGVELHAKIEFSMLTKGEATDLVALLKKSIADAQLHGKSFEDAAEEHMEMQGKLRASRRISVFIKADNPAVAEIKLQEIYRGLNAKPGYDCEVVGRYVLDGNGYHKVA